MCIKNTLPKNQWVIKGEKNTWRPVKMETQFPKSIVHRKEGSLRGAFIAIQEYHKKYFFEKNFKIPLNLWLKELEKKKNKTQSQ